MNAIDLLIEDHERVKDLLTRLTESTERAVKTRTELLSKLEMEVTIHTQLEEQILYPAYKEAGGKEELKMYHEAKEEHRAVDSLVLPDLKATDPGSVQFSGRAKVCKELLEHHIEEEESEMFPQAREVFDAKRLEAQVSPAEVEPFDEAAFEKFPDLVKGYIGPAVLGAESVTGIRYLTDPRVVAAMIGGAVVAGGWVVTHLLSARRDRAARAERVRDVQGALYAEIRVHVATLKGQSLPVYGAEMEAMILKGDGFFPVIPTEQNDRLFSAIVENIHVLPFRVVDPVVQYYNQLATIGAMIADLRALDLARVGPERAARMYRHYIEMKVEAIDLGSAAKLFLHTHLTGGNAAVAELVAAREKARLVETKAGLQAWVAAHGATQAVSGARSPASGRSGQ